MAVRVSWLKEERVILWNFYDNTSITDIQAAEVKTYVMMQSSPALSIPVIFDLRQAKHLPSVVEATKVAWILPSYRKNTTNIFIGFKNPLLNFALSASYKMSNTRFEVVSTFPEAVDHLRSEHASMRNLLTQDA